MTLSSRNSVKKMNTFRRGKKANKSNIQTPQAVLNSSKMSCNASVHSFKTLSREYPWQEKAYRKRMEKIKFYHIPLIKNSFNESTFHFLGITTVRSKGEYKVT